MCGVMLLPARGIQSRGLHIKLEAVTWERKFSVSGISFLVNVFKPHNLDFIMFGCDLTINSPLMHNKQIKDHVLRYLCI